jgi:hypothetical protein
MATIKQAVTLVERVSPNDPNRLPMPKPIYNAPVAPPNAHKRANGSSPIKNISRPQTWSGACLTAGALTPDLSKPHWDSSPRRLALVLVLTARYNKKSCTGI